MEIKNVCIIGMGALGILYGARIQDSAEAFSLKYVMDEGRWQKYQGKPVFCNGKEYHFDMIAAEHATACDLVIVAVMFVVK